jgi:hypothetical protein
MKSNKTLLDLTRNGSTLQTNSTMSDLTDDKELVVETSSSSAPPDGPHVTGDPAEVPLETNAKSTTVEAVNEWVEAKPANRVDISSPACEEPVSTAPEKQEPAIVEMEASSSTVVEKVAAKIVVVAGGATETVVARRKKEAPDTKISNPTATKIVQNEEFKPNINAAAKTSVVGIIKEQTGRGPRGGGVLVMDEFFDAHKVSQRNAQYGTPIDFELPAVVADMEAREMERRQIIQKRGTPAIKINEFVRVLVVSIVVESVTPSSSSRSPYAQW